MQEPLDSADLDALIDLETSPGYALVVERIQKVLEQKRLELERRADGTMLRGEIAALRLVLTIPSILKQEAKGLLECSPKR